jgi:hypothetical protein
VNDRFLRACRREPVDMTPVWFMRQAGRYMPEYRKLREKHTLIELCKNPELALQVTLQPLKLGVESFVGVGTASRETAGGVVSTVKLDGALLPLSKSARLHVAGSGATDLGIQAGGWTLGWQGSAGVDTGAFGGGTTILDERRQTPQTVIEVFRRFAPTMFAAVPTFFARMLAAGVLTKNDVPRLRRCVSAAEPLPPELYRLWLETTGVPIMDGIGSTEVGHIYISNRIGDIRPGTSGKPVRGYQVRIVDEAGNNVADEMPGRLLVKGQSVTRRYWNDPERTAKVLVDGWFDSSDTFRLEKALVTDRAFWIRAKCASSMS